MIKDSKRGQTFNQLIKEGIFYSSSVHYYFQQSSKKKLDPAQKNRNLLRSWFFLCTLLLSEAIGSANNGSELNKESSISKKDSLSDKIDKKQEEESFEMSSLRQGTFENSVLSIKIKVPTLLLSSKAQVLQKEKFSQKNDQENKNNEYHVVWNPLTQQESSSGSFIISGFVSGLNRSNILNYVNLHEKNLQTNEVISTVLDVKYPDKFDIQHFLVEKNKKIKEILLNQKIENQDIKEIGYPHFSTKNNAYKSPGLYEYFIEPNFDENLEKNSITKEKNSLNQKEHSSLMEIRSESFRLFIKDPIRISIKTDRQTSDNFDQFYQKGDIIRLFVQFPYDFFIFAKGKYVLYPNEDWDIFFKYYYLSMETKTGVIGYAQGISFDEIRNSFIFEYKVQQDDSQGPDKGLNFDKLMEIADNLRFPKFFYNYGKLDNPNIRYTLIDPENGVKEYLKHTLKTNNLFEANFYKNTYGAYIQGELTYEKLINHFVEIGIYIGYMPNPSSPNRSIYELLKIEPLLALFETNTINLQQLTINKNKAQEFQVKQGDIPSFSIFTQDTKPCQGGTLLDRYALLTGGSGGI